MKRLLTSRRSILGSIGIALATSSIAAAQWPGGEEPSYLLISIHHGQAEVKLDSACPTDVIPQRDWGSAKPRITAQGKLCIKLAPDIDAVRIEPHGGACSTMPGLVASKPSDTATLTFASPAASLQGCQISEASSKPAYGGIAIDFADGYSVASAFHGEAPDIVVDSPPGSPAAATGAHAWRYRLDLHRASANMSEIVSVAAPLTQARPAVTIAAPTKLTPAAEQAGASAGSFNAPVETPGAGRIDPVKTPQIWATTVGLRFRAQIEQWIEKVNQGCGGEAAPCYRLAPHDAAEPVEPWRIQMVDQIGGDFLTALAFLRDGFADAPRPDIEVTRNNIVIIHTLGSDR